ncbi:MAG: dihydrofolate reductase [Bacteroidetes bacterium]|nr:dihydrofolate reductase [Bacteroidota bacterium]
MNTRLKSFAILGLLAAGFCTIIVAQTAPKKITPPTKVVPPTNINPQKSNTNTIPPNVKLPVVGVTKPITSPQEWQTEVERFADLQILRYKVKGFENLTLQQKKLSYYLYKAALSGREIIFDQHFKHNLLIKRTLEGIVSSYKGNRKSADWDKFMVYTKRFWFSNGIHHHYSTQKFLPDFSEAYFKELIANSDPDKLPIKDNDPMLLFSFIKPMVFDANFFAKKVNLAPDIDNVTASANNFYEGVTKAEVEKFYDAKNDTANKRPLSYGLNSKLVKEDGQIVEKVWKVGGMYSSAIEKIVYWLEKAKDVAETPEQNQALEKLCLYYNTGELFMWDDYNIAWVQDTKSKVDVTNGFIEVYGDAMGKRGSYESVVSFKDMEATKMIEKIGNQAQWFEDHSPITDIHKKKTVVGITAKVITVIVESGDAAPSTPVGINLPNADWIRKEYGSKSVSLGNIVEAYNMVGAKSPSMNEFGVDAVVIARIKKYGALASDLHTDMHEVIGHASGQINPGVATPDQTLKTYRNTLEEARADLVGLYYIMDKKLVEMGVMPSLEVGMAQYDSYILNGMMTQLNRLNLGDNLEEAHMRNRQLIASWVYEKGKTDKVIERISKGGKTYFKINDYFKLRTLFGDLLKEIQRIKSEGDYEAGKKLVEGYGVKVDAALHKEVKERFSKLNIAPYKGFLQPRLVPVMKGEQILDVKIEYPKDFTEQMMEYSKDYSFLKPNEW